MKINQNLLSKSKYSLKSPYSMVPEFIVVHNTANDASAENEIAYMVNNDLEVSFHYAVDGTEVWQGVPTNRNAWHAGDGEEGQANRKGIAIEICYSKGGGPRFTAAEKNAAKFIAELLKEHGWGVDKVKKHQDFNGKYCPHRTLDMGWQRFLNMVKAELEKLTPAKEETKPASTGKTYIVKKGDTMSEIAEAQGVTLEALIKANPQIKDPNLILPGQKLSIPSGEAKKEPAKKPQKGAQELKEGDKVKMAKGAPVYGTALRFDAWVYDTELYIRELDGSRAVVSSLQAGAVTGAVDKKYLTKI